MEPVRLKSETPSRDRSRGIEVDKGCSRHTVPNSLHDNSTSFVDVRDHRTSPAFRLG
jgi:hypothetical protein